MRPDQLERYARHLMLKEVGGAGQAALLGAKVAIIGAGGLGGPAGLYLAAAGVGHITIIDDDVVEASNLQRQIQFTHRDRGKAKSTVMADTLIALNPDTSPTPVQNRLTGDNAPRLLEGHDIVLDGTDSFEARYATNEACHALRIPLISGALGRFNGQVSLFDNQGDGPCYRCLVPEIPPNAETCAEVGVVGALAGIIGSMMALEAIKYITGAGETLSGRLWLYNGLTCESRTVTLSRDPECETCGQ